MKPSEPGEYGVDALGHHAVPRRQPSASMRAAVAEAAATVAAQEAAAAESRARAHRDDWSDEHRTVAALLGVPPAHVLEFHEAPEGLVVSTLNTTPRMVIVPADRPDAEGKTGVMLLDPTPSEMTNRAAGVYCHALPPEPEPEPEPADELPRGPWLADERFVSVAREVWGADAELVALEAAQARDAARLARDDVHDAEREQLGRWMESREDMLRARRMQTWAAWLDAHPAPPPSWEVTDRRSALAYCERILSTPPGELPELVRWYADNVGGSARFVNPYDSAAVRRERDALLAWFTEHDIDPATEGVPA